jgi:hypothetical protein
MKANWKGNIKKWLPIVFLSWVEPTRYSYCFYYSLYASPGALKRTVGAWSSYAVGKFSGTAYADVVAMFKSRKAMPIFVKMDASFKQGSWSLVGCS